jgi:hypothetical protein
MWGIYRCDDGHLFQRTLREMLLEANLGPKRHKGRCPVDGKWVFYIRVNRAELSEDQISEIKSCHNRL